MLEYWDSPFGLIEMYGLMIGLGFISCIILQGIIVIKHIKNRRVLLFYISFLLIMYMGGYTASIIRIINDGVPLWDISLLQKIADRTGSHFLGYILLFALFFYPLAYFLRYFLREIFGYEVCSNEEMIKSGGIMSCGLIIQHIFNRIACVCKGCCYGIPYNGLFSMNFVYNDVVHEDVFPSQLFEILCMVILFIVVIIPVMKGKNVFSVVLIGFAITFFISEFVMSKNFSYKYHGLSGVQYFSIILIVISVVHIVWFRNSNLNNVES